MRSAVVVEADPISDDACGVLDAFETVSVLCFVPSMFGLPDHLYPRGSLLAISINF